jgi:CO dehydrogenase maturation factor
MLASFLSFIFAKCGYSVLAIDADPNSNLAATLGFPNPDKIIPISEMTDLIEERTGARPGEAAVFFKVNPNVADIPERFSLEKNGIKLMVMGRLKKGGRGCYCPENALLEALVAHLLLKRDDMVIMDMEAGVEHLGRGTAKAVDKMIIVVEPSKRSIETAYRIRELARDIGLQNIAVVGNKIRSDKDKECLISSMPDFEFLGFIPYDQAIVEADLAGLPLVNSSPKVTSEVKASLRDLIGEMKAAHEILEREVPMI